MVDNSTYRVLKHLYKKEREELSVLRALVNYDGPTTYSPHLSALLEDKMIALCHGEGVPDGEGGFISSKTYFRITVNGRAYVEQKQKSLWNFWLPYTITTVIAVGSLVVSIVALTR